MFEHLMMKHLFLLFFLVVITAASAIADEPNESRLEAEPFVHPGLLHSRVRFCKREGSGRSGTMEVSVGKVAIVSAA